MVEKKHQVSVSEELYLLNTSDKQNMALRALMFLVYFGVKCHTRTLRHGLMK